MDEPDWGIRTCVCGFLGDLDERNKMCLWYYGNLDDPKKLVFLGRFGRPKQDVSVVSRAIWTIETRSDGRRFGGSGNSGSRRKLTRR